MKRAALLLLFLAACKPKPDPVVTALPPMPAPEPPPKAAPGLDPKTWLTADHLRAADLGELTPRLEESGPREAMWVLAREKGPSGQLHVRLFASAEEAAGVLAAARGGASARPEAKVLLRRDAPDVLLATEEPFVPQGTVIRTLDLTTVSGRALVHLRLEETSTSTDGPAAAAAMERKARALLERVGR